ncbi:MAG: hypothetical protein R3C68_02765 [Myxococcota bacterium]
MGRVPFEDISRYGMPLRVAAMLPAAPESFKATLFAHRGTAVRWDESGLCWSDVILPTVVQDTQCGFKRFTRYAHRLFETLHCRNFAFHVEILAKAQRLGMQVTEVPVRWIHRPGSKIRLLQDPMHMLWELLQTAYHHRAQTRRTARCRANKLEVPTL